ncbi:hypothetical protein ACS3SW_07590 [Roseobacteraceae bacterium S113]
MALICAFSCFIGSSSRAEDIIRWQPDDFDGVVVSVTDRATNGCWTNIGEATQYSIDQLELAGFTSVEMPQIEEDDPSPLLTDNLVMFAVVVEAKRLSDGLCVGHIMTQFVGSVVLPNRRDIVVVNPIGPGDAWTVWSDVNLNNYALDQIKGYISSWVKYGVTAGSND